MNFKLYCLLGLMIMMGSCGEEQVTKDEQVSQNEEMQEQAQEEAAAPQPAYRFDHEQQLTIAELEGLNKEELALLRNEIYAYHGYRFKNQKLNNDFAAQGYPVNVDDVSDQLTSVDAHNLALIQSLEKSHATQDVAIGLEDIDFTGEVADEFRTFLRELLVAANEGDTTFISDIIHPDYSTAPGFIVKMIGQRAYSSEKERVTYAAHPCEEDYYCRGCNERADLGDNDKVYVFGVTYHYDDAEADRDSSALYYFFVETPNGYRLYCEFAAG